MESIEGTLMYVYWLNVKYLNTTVVATIRSKDGHKTYESKDSTLATSWSSISLTKAPWEMWTMNGKKKKKELQKHLQ